MDYTAADLEQNRKIDELAHGLAKLTAKVSVIEEKLQPWDDLARRIMPAVEFFERLKGDL